MDKSKAEPRPEVYIITDAQLSRESGDVHIDSTDIGMSHHFLVWLELGRTAKNSLVQCIKLVQKLQKPRIIVKCLT